MKKKLSQEVGWRRKRKYNKKREEESAERTGMKKKV